MLFIRPPRRTRRPLLLPPGWLALGWLLVLGCGLLQAHWRQLRQVNVVQLMMVPLKPNSSLINFYRVLRQDTAEYNPFIDAGARNAVSKIDRMRPWHTIDFGGQRLRDFLTAQAIESAIRLVQADSAHAGGVRIRFRAGATYANLMKVLDMIAITNQKKYWLDIQHQPVTLYAITVKELPRDLATEFICGYRSVPPPPPSSWQQWLHRWQQWLTALQQPAWRIPLLLLAVLGSLSACRLALGTKSG